MMRCGYLSEHIVLFELATPSLCQGLRSEIYQWILNYKLQQDSCQICYVATNK